LVQTLQVSDEKPETERTGVVQGHIDSGRANTRIQIFYLIGQYACHWLGKIRQSDLPGTCSAVSTLEKV
jgi:hypothetical protein